MPETTVNQRDFVIVCHNAHWFQGQPWEGSVGPPYPPVFLQLAALYRRLRPDLLCLQEVQDRHAFRLMGESLDLAGAYCPGGTETEFGGASYWRSGGYLGDSVAAHPAPRRFWQLSQVGNKPDWSVMNLHLTSDKAGGAAAEALRLRDLDKALKSAGRPAFVLGDFNEPPNSSAGMLLTNNGYEDAARVAGNTATSTGFGKPRVDQVWVHGRFRALVKRLRVFAPEEMRCSDPARQYLSDHYPIVFTIGD